VKEGKVQGHHAVVYGLGLAILPQPALLTSWAFQSLSSVCLSSPKLLRIGQDSVQRVLTASLVGMEEKVALSLTINREELAGLIPSLK